MFRLPPPYLWTPPTPQRVKGCSPLTNLKKKSKHKKASAAPVGAIALTLFFASPFIVPQSLRDSSPRGSGHARRAALSQKAALHLPFSVTTPLVKKMNGKIRRFSRSSNIKIIIPLSMRSNDDDRRQWRKQGGVVGAAASKTRVPLKARSGCWEPQPVSGAH